MFSNGAGANGAGTYVCRDAEDAVRRFGAVLAFDEAIWPELRAELRGKSLACWCPLDQPCHADVLLELANAKDTRNDAD
jgi:hypothetical protein